MVLGLQLFSFSTSLNGTRYTFPLPLRIEPMLSCHSRSVSRRDGGVMVKPRIEVKYRYRPSGEPIGVYSRAGELMFRGSSLARCHVPSRRKLTHRSWPPTPPGRPDANTMKLSSGAT